MNYTQLVSHFGGPTKAGKTLGLDRRTVHAWSAMRRIPSRWQLKLEMLSAGKLRADEDARQEAAEFAAYLKTSRRGA